MQILYLDINVASYGKLSEQDFEATLNKKY